jgi:hypothetical protein
VRALLSCAAAWLCLAAPASADVFNASIPAPRTDRRCGDAVRSGRGAYDVRRAGKGLTCRQARGLARRWVVAGRPAHVRGYTATATDFGGTRRVELRRRDGGRRALVAFLYQRSAGR